MKYFRLIASAIIFTLSLTVVEAYHAATFTVINTNDSGAGSLRQAILDANASTESNTINFDPTVFGITQVITLTSGHLFIRTDGTGYLNQKSLTINGPGANKLTINGNNHSRIFRIEEYGRATINSVKISNGNGMDNGVIPETNSKGGGILVDGGTLSDGTPNLLLTNSIVSDNTSIVGESNLAGGICVFGRVTISNSAIVNNVSTHTAGAIYVNATLTIINTTISGNVAQMGGAFTLNTANLYLINSTVAFNHTPTGSGFNGILAPYQSNENNFFHARNSIIAKNSTPQYSGYDIYGKVQAGGNNIIGNTDGVLIFPEVTNNQLDVDPQLDLSLDTNGGVIPSHSISATSTALDRGDNCVLTTTANGGCVTIALSSDVRGVTRPQDADGNGTATVDIGVLEITRTEILNAPSVAPDLHSADDSGVSNTDNITSHTNLTFDVGGLTNGATVELFRDGFVIASGTVVGNTITVTDSGVAVGLHNYSSRQTISGTRSLSSPLLSVRVDTIAPTATINQAAGQNDPTGVLPVNFSVVFNEAVTGFTASDISLTGSTANVGTAVVNVTDVGGGASYNVSVNNVTTGGTVVINFPASAVQDLAGNSGAGPTVTDNTITLDFTPPAVTINQAASQIEPTNVMPVVFTVVFSEPVTGFDNADVSLAGSTASIATATKTVTGSGANYTVSIGGITSNGGFVRATILAQTAVDLAGNGNLASTSTDNTITVDNIAPAATVNQAAGQPDPTSVLPVNYAVTFNESVTGFDASDISFTNSTVNTSGLTVSITGSGTTYNIAVGGNVVNGGLLRVSVRAGAATDAAGNPSQASTSTDNTITILSRRAPFDFDGDGKTDLSIFRPSVGEWWYLKSSNGGNAAAQFGASTDKIMPGDFTGDGKTDIAFWRPSNGFWFVLRSEDFSYYSFPFGTTGDIPAVGDFDGDGKADPTIFRPSNATWYISKSSGGTLIQQFGQNGDVPVVSDYDGDGKADIAIYRVALGEWWIQRSTAGIIAFQFGNSSDKPVPGDFTGDSKSDVGLFRPSTGEWFVLRSEDQSYYSFPFGTNGDIPAPGDYDGDGKFDATVFRPSSSTWYAQRSTAGTLIQSFGQSGDSPVPSAFVP